MKGGDDGKSDGSSEDSVNMGRNVNLNQIQSTRLREKNIAQKVDNDERKRS